MIAFVPSKCLMLPLFPALRKNLISSLVLSRFCFNAHVVGNSSCFYVVVCDQFSCSLFMCVTVPFSVYDVSRTHVCVFMRTLLTDVTHPCIWHGARNMSLHIHLSFSCITWQRSVELFWYSGTETRQRKWWCASLFLVSGGSKAVEIATRRGASRCAIRILKLNCAREATQWRS